VLRSWTPRKYGIACLEAAICLAQTRDHGRATARNLPAGPPGSAFSTRICGSSRARTGLACPRLMSTSITRAGRHRKSAPDQSGLADLQPRRLRRRSVAGADRACLMRAFSRRCATSSSSPAPASSQGRGGIVTDVRTGGNPRHGLDPRLRPQQSREALDPTRVNRLTFGLYEMARPSRRSRWAMALAFGKGSPYDSVFDGEPAATHRKFAIHDFHAQNRVLSRARDLHYSSISPRRASQCPMALIITSGLTRQLDRSDRIPAATDAAPHWGEREHRHRSPYGHGLAVSPLQAHGGRPRSMNGDRSFNRQFLNVRSESQRARPKSCSLRPAS